MLSDFCSTICLKCCSHHDIDIGRLCLTAELYQLSYSLLLKLLSLRIFYFRISIFIVNSSYTRIFLDYDWLILKLKTFLFYLCIKHCGLL